MDRRQFRLTFTTCFLVCYSVMICGCSEVSEGGSGATERLSANNEVAANFNIDSLDNDCPNVFSNFHEWEGTEATEAKLLTMSAECRNQLTEVGLRQSFSDKSMEALAGADRLQNLSLADNNRISEQGLLKMGTLESLRGFTYIAPRHNPPHDVWTQPSLTRKVFDQLVRLELLEGFFISSDLLEDNLFEPLKDCPSLKKIVIHGRSSLTEETLLHIAEVEQLEELSFRAKDWNGSGLRYLAKLPHLRKLVLDGNAIDDQSLAEISQLLQLHQLDLGETQITDAGMPAVGRLNDLRVLHLDNTGVTIQSLPIIKQLKHLDRLATDRTVDDALFQSYMRTKTE